VTVDVLAKPVIDHILHIWCKGDQKVCDYLLSWMAHLVQFPWKKMTVCPVLKGGQGAGKGIIISHFLKSILGTEHFIAVMDVERVLGKFQMEKTKTNLLTFLDECTFAGDKRQASKLKGLLSECDRHFEAKFVNGFTLRNYSNFIIASNYDKIVLVEKDDRRYMCIEVDSKFSGPQTPESKDYFDTLLTVNPQHFAHFLYSRDVAGWNARSAPSTEYMRYQKKSNFGSVMDWLEECLREDMQVFKEEEEAVHLKHRLFANYTEFCERGDQKYKNVHGERTFWRFLRAALPGLGDAGKRPSLPPPNRQVRLPKLNDARTMFMAHVKEQNWNWSQ
jgi:hypothetical protein